MDGAGYIVEVLVAVGQLSFVAFKAYGWKFVGVVVGACLAVFVINNHP